MRTAVLRVVMGLLVTMSLGVAISSTGGATTYPGHPTLTQLEADLAASLQMGKIDSLAGSIPALNVAPRTSEGRVSTSCDASSYRVALPANVSWRCGFGDLRVTRTIFLFGDADAAMWIPAFRTLGRDLHWKVVILARTGCSPWSYGTKVGSRGCRHVVNEEIALANEMHPAVVIPMGGKVSWRGSKSASVRFLRDGIGRVIHALSPSHAHVILFEPIPKFNHGYTPWTPQICLRTYDNRLQPCEAVIYKDATTSTAAEATTEAAFADNVPLIQTRLLFCSNKLCALFVKAGSSTRLIYRDASDMNLDYADWISGALATMIHPYLR